MPMALRATVYRADLAIADITRGYYATHTLTLARHPSETEERLMVRLLAFALFADAALVFGRGLSTEDEPALWRRDDTGAIDLWIDVGLPEERNLRKACGRAREVIVLAYGGPKAQQWRTQMRSALARLLNLRVMAVSAETTTQLAGLAARSMSLDCTIHEGAIWLGNGTTSVACDVRQWLPQAVA
jgi:uncharacterized protein YaeQ